MDIDVMQKQLAALMVHKPMLDAMANAAGSDADTAVHTEADDVASMDDDGLRDHVAKLTEHVEQLEATVDALVKRAEDHISALPEEHVETLSRMHACIDKVEALLAKFPFLHNEAEGDTGQHTDDPQSEPQPDQTHSKETHTHTEETRTEDTHTHTDETHTDDGQAVETGEPRPEEVPLEEQHSS